MTVSHLQELAKCANFGLRGAATHALAIVRDIREHGVKGFDVYLLRNLLDELYAESGESLFEHRGIALQIAISVRRYGLLGGENCRPLDPVAESR